MVRALGSMSVGRVAFFALVAACTSQEFLSGATDTSSDVVAEERAEGGPNRPSAGAFAAISISARATRVTVAP